MDNIDDAIQALKNGNFVLIHDSEGRENETDFLIPAQHITPAHIAQMRADGGGLICAAISKELCDSIQLPFTSDIHSKAKEKFPLLGCLTPDDIPYDEKSSFAVWVNHRGTFTGITDTDRALTIKKLAEILLPHPTPEEFGKKYRSPGHIPLLRSSGLNMREGHTELAVALLKLAGLTPVAAICEMMDAETHRAASVEKTRAYAEEHDIVLLEAADVKNAWRDKNG